MNKIGKILKYLDRGTQKKIVHAFITCHLDNNNGLLYPGPQCLWQARDLGTSDGASGTQQIFMNVWWYTAE